MGSQIKFAIRTLRSGGRGRSDYPLFGRQLRFALRTLREAIREERERAREVPGEPQH